MNATKNLELKLQLEYSQVSRVPAESMYPLDYSNEMQEERPTKMFTGITKLPPSKNSIYYHNMMAE